MNQVIPWHGSIFIDLFIGGMAVGAFLFAMILSHYNDSQKYSRLIKIGVYTAPVALGIGMLFLLSHLGRPERFYVTLFNINPSSVMSWGVFLQGIFFVTSLYVAIMTFLQKRDALFKAAKIIAIISAVGVGLYHGQLFSANVGRALWNDGLFSILFFISSFLAGSSFVMLTGLVFTKSEIDVENFSGQKFLVVLLFSELAAVIIWMMNIANSGSDAQFSLQYLLSNYSLAWWGGVVLLGLVLPLLIIGYQLFKKNTRAKMSIILANLLIILGGAVLKYVLLFAGQVQSPTFLGF